MLHDNYRYFISCESFSHLTCSYYISMVISKASWGGILRPNRQPLIAGQRYHIVATVSGTTMTTYINSVAEAKKVDGWEPRTMRRSTCTIGAPGAAPPRGQTPHGYFSGVVSSLAIYRGAMTQAQVTAAYAAAFPILEFAWDFRGVSSQASTLDAIQGAPLFCFCFQLPLIFLFYSYSFCLRPFVFSPAASLLFPSFMPIQLEGVSATVQCFNKQCSLPDMRKTTGITIGVNEQITSVGMASFRFGGPLTIETVHTFAAAYESSNTGIGSFANALFDWGTPSVSNPRDSMYLGGFGANGKTTFGRPFCAVNNNYDGSAFFVTSKNDLVQNQPYHIVVTSSGADLKLYVDGALAGSCNTCGEALTKLRSDFKINPAHITKYHGEVSQFNLCVISTTVITFRANPSHL